jgi:molybdopterin-guanine dinucleotide biosynthesis protein A
MAEYSKIPCVILAGGASTRFDAPKGLALLNGMPLVEIVEDRLRRQTSGPIAISASQDGPYRDRRREIIEDVLPGGLGPLAGIHAALTWARVNDQTTIVTTPVDTPFLPDDLIETFAKVGAPVIASSAWIHHPICGLWAVSQLGELEKMIAAGKRAANAWAEASGAKVAVFEVRKGKDPFFNINTVADLDRAHSLLNMA